MDRVKVPTGEVLCVPAVDEGEDRVGFVGEQSVDHPAGDTTAAMFRQHDQRGEFATAVRVLSDLGDTDGCAVGFGDDEPAPVEAAWVQPSLVHQVGDRGLVVDRGAPDPVLHGPILPGRSRMPAS